MDLGLSTLQIAYLLVWHSRTKLMMGRNSGGWHVTVMYVNDWATNLLSDIGSLRSQKHIISSIIGLSDLRFAFASPVGRWTAYNSEAEMTTKYKLQLFVKGRTDYRDYRADRYLDFPCSANSDLKVIFC